MADNPEELSKENNLLRNNSVLYKIASFSYSENIEKLMNRDVFLCKPDDTVQSVAKEMAVRRIS